MALPADPRINGFFITTGATFAAFASGFGVCLFDLEQVNACLRVADQWVDIFHRMGNHILQWGIAIVHGVFG
jgi:hypothetical protein